MKKRLISILLTLCLAIGSIFAFTACSSDPLTQKEFSQAIVNSYETFYKNHNSYEVFDDITITATQNNSENYSFEWEYTPDGATTPTKVTYTEVETEKTSIDYSVKRINGDLFFTVKTVEEEVETTYDTSKPNTAPLTAEYACYKEVNNWVFGVENGVYYVKNERVLQEGEQTLGQPQTTKTYNTFANVEAYKLAIMGCMEVIDEEILVNAYDLFSDSSMEYIMMYLGTLLKIDKEDDVYGVSYNVVAPVIDKYDKAGGIIELELIAKYGTNGVISFSQNTYMDQDPFVASADLNLDVEYASNITAETNALDGYTLDTGLDYTDFYVYFGISL